MLRLPSASASLSFERNGHVTLRSVLPPSAIEDILPSIDSAYQRQAIDVYRQKLRVLIGEEEVQHLEASGGKQTLSRLKAKLNELPTDAIPFLQAFNLWRTCGEVAALASSPALAGTAANLLGVPRVRLYQDSLFVKRPGDGPTHWHSDLAMSPLDTNDFVTAWVPLQPVPPEEEGGSGLVFADRSHKDVALHFWQYFVHGGFEK